MKKILFLSSLLLLTLVNISGCKKKKKDDPDPGTSVESDYCVKRTYQDSSDNYTNGATELFKFRGGKWVYYNSDIHRSGYISSREQVEYTYNSEGLLSTMVTYSNNGQSKEYTNYEYSNGKILGYSTTETGLYPSSDGYPKGKYYYDGNGRMSAFVEQYTDTQKDSLILTVNEIGKITYKKVYKNGVLYEEQTEFAFDANGNQTAIRYKRFNSSGVITLDSKHTDVYVATKNPVFADTWTSLYGGYRPIYNDNFYMNTEEESTDMVTSQLNSKHRTVLFYDDQNRLIRSRREEYNIATSTWEFQYDYEYEYTCD